MLRRYSRECLSFNLVLVRDEVDVETLFALGADNNKKVFLLKACLNTELSKFAFVEAEQPKIPCKRVSIN